MTRYHVVLLNDGQQTLVPVNNLAHAAQLAIEESDGPLKVWDRIYSYWVSGAEVLLAAIEGNP